MLQHTLVTPTTLKCPELARWARLIACGGDMSPVGPLDDAAPSTAHTSLPCQKTPADLGIPGKFVGRTSLIARRGSARPPIFLYSGVEQPSSDHLPRRPRRKPTSATENRLRSARISRVLLCSARTFKGGAKFKYSVERTYLIRGQKSNFNNFSPVV